MNVRALVMALALLGAPLAGQAQGVSGLRGLSLACVQAGPGLGCKPFLEATNRLKKRAEADKQLRCYTALLGFEAQVMALPVGSGSDPAVLDSAYGELSAECEPIR
ncbi:MAG: hypothetical protein RLZZ533_838 [Cyanobacteriota bacterium]